MNRQSIARKTHCQYKALTPKNPVYRFWIRRFTFEEIEFDLGRGDLTSTLLANKKISARIVAKERGILAGMQEVQFFLKHLRAHGANPYNSAIAAKFFKKDGESLAKGQSILELSGPALELMKIERAILNLIGRMSGIATLTARLTEKVRKAVPNILLTPTRKTLWGLLDKRACVVGGGGTHRLGLDNAILIKHNHVRASGEPLQKFLQSVFARSGATKQSRLVIPAKAGIFQARFFEIEVNNVNDALSAASMGSVQKRKIGTGQFCVMFDNMTPRDISSSLKKIKSMGFYRDILFEASGNISEKNLTAYAKTGVDILSLGMLTHSAPMLDVSMRIAR